MAIQTRAMLLSFDTPCYIAEARKQADNIRFLASQHCAMFTASCARSLRYSTFVFLLARNTSIHSQPQSSFIANMRWNVHFHYMV